MIQVSTMVGLRIIIFITLFTTTTFPPLGWARGHRPKNTWAKTVDVSKNVLATTLRFYFQDRPSGNNRTVFLVAQANKSETLELAFGNVFMFDAPLTIRPDPDSKLVGRAQGMYASDSRDLRDEAVFMSMSFTFSRGIYNGSSITIVGHNPITHLKRELPVLGGTGIFRLGRGYAFPLAYKSDLVTGNAIVGYNVTILHYHRHAFSDFSSVIDFIM